MSKQLSETDYKVFKEEFENILRNLLDIDDQVEFLDKINVFAINAGMDETSICPNINNFVCNNLGMK